MPHVAIAWLRKEDWDRWQEIDNQLPAYDRWLAKIEDAIKQSTAPGSTPTKVDVDPDTFLAWCKTNGKPVHRDSRAQYAAQMLIRKLGAH
ncbi:hypothetical protein JJB99_08000 [Bradyrhizobium diazoefficiens]|uniref:hypothetical protein n=1 Tax=Bradyrhizobium diazoefficiens TaxID=1355477 RepID=UPI00190C6CAB|nr:hypothetical protein [Bradyrhizobium diazoefficiens]QQO16084.1 hypothetical protein JJB99_08000 [Bradyrhizobium diazoefficiens]